MKKSVTIEWFSADIKPDHEERILVHVPELEGRYHTEALVFGRYIKSLDEWRIEGSPSKWEIDWWAEVPNVPQGES